MVPEEDLSTKGGKGKGKGKGKVGKGEGGYQKIVSEGHRAMTF